MNQIESTRVKNSYELSDCNFKSYYVLIIKYIALVNQFKLWVDNIYSSKETPRVFYLIKFKQFFIKVIF